MATRELPRDPVAEQNLLGSILIDPGAIWKAAPLVQPSDFAEQKHRWIFEATMAVAREGKDATNVLLVLNELQRHKRAEAVGGLPGLTNLMSATVSSVYVEDYAGIVRDKAIRREMLKAATDLARYAYDEQRHTDDGINAVVTGLQEHGRGGDVRPASEVASEVLDLQAAYYEDKLERGQVRGLDTGWTQMNRITQGWKPGFYLWIGVSHVGKTWAMLHALENVVAQGHRGLLFSLEMSAVQLVTRLGLAHANITREEYDSGRYDQERYERFRRYVATIRDHYHLDIVDGTPPFSVIAATINREMRTPTPPAMVVLDYFGLIRTTERAENNNMEQIVLSRGLKALSHNLQVPLHTAAQVSDKAMLNRSNKRPQKFDAYGSSGPEQDADVIITIYRDDMYHKDQRNRGVLEWRKVKDRLSGGSSENNTALMTFTDAGRISDAPQLTIEDYQAYLLQSRDGSY